MESAENLKHQTTQIRRIASGVRSVISLAKQNNLSKVELKALEKAAEILGKLGSRTSSSASTAAAVERDKARQLETATAEAIKIISAWPAATTLDKVSLIVGNRGEHLLSKAVDDIDSDAAWTLNYWFQEASREIPQRVAFKAVDGDMSVFDVMREAEARLVKIKGEVRTKLLAERLQIRLGQEA